MKALNPLHVAILLASAALFAQVGGFGLLNLDDYAYVVDFAGKYSLGWAFTWAGDGMWTPLTRLSYWLDWTLFGENWGAYHLHNVALHALNGVLVYALALKAAGRGRAWVALFAALLWAVHPLRVESVAWIAARKDCLSAFFFLLALLCWVHGRRWPSVLASLALLSLGGLAKSSVMVFPAFVVAWDVLIARRLRHWSAYLFAVAVSCGFAAEAAWAQGQGDAYAVSESIPRWYRLLNALCAATVYVRNLVWPDSLAVQCQLKYPCMPRFSLIGLALLAALVWRCAAHLAEEARAISSAGGLGGRPPSPVLAGALMAGLSILPFLGFVGFGSHAFADRFTILPCVGLAVAAAGMRLRGMAARAACAAAVCGLGWATVRQVAYWRDDGTLFGRTLAVDGDENLLAHKVLALYHYENDHDFSKIYEHVSSVLRARAQWQADMIAVVGYLGVEAAFETGRREEAMDLYFGISRWSDAQVASLRRVAPHVTTTATFLIADAVRLAYTEGQMELARSKLAELEAAYPGNFAVRNLRCIVARRGGDRRELVQALEAAGDVSGESYVRNRWAQRELERLKGGS